MLTLYTIGHSNRALGEFMAMLRAAGVEILVDVRQQPRSSRYPQFGEAGLREATGAVGIQYHWAGRQLGGRREPAADSPHTALPDALRGYADLMDKPAFAKAVTQLVGLAQRGPTALLCAERDPLQCHRSLIADYVTLQGIEVVHLLAPGQTQTHLLRPEVRRESAALIYDRQVTAELPLD